MLRIQKHHADEMIAHALAEYPNECCGILTGKDGTVSRIYRITNTVKSPTRYLMDPQEQLSAMLEAERRGEEVLAFYHSHTRGALRISDTDVRMALQSGWLDVYYVLVLLHDRNNPRIGAFRVSDTGAVTEEELEVV